MRRLIPRLPGLCLLGLMLFLAACQEPKKDAATPVSVVNEARQAWLVNDFATAESRYQAYLQQFPDGPDRLESWKRLADIAFAVRGQAAPAVTLLESALLERNLRPFDVLVLTTLAMETAMSGQQYDKVAAFAQKLLARPDLPGHLVPVVSLRLSRARLSLGDPKAAETTLRQCRDRLSNAGEAAPCSLRLGLLLEKRGDKEGLAVLQALYETPDAAPELRAQAGFALGEAAEAARDTAKARSWYEAVQETFPNPKVVKKRLKLLHK